MKVTKDGEGVIITEEFKLNKEMLEREVSRLKQALITLEKQTKEVKDRIKTLEPYI